MSTAACVRSACPASCASAARGLTHGYVNQPELTARQFVTAGPDTGFSRTQRSTAPVTARAGDTMAGLSISGRFDDQVKLRGYRIEPGEIESRLAAHPGVAQAHVAVRDDAGGEAQLIAYVVSRDQRVQMTTSGARTCGNGCPSTWCPATLCGSTSCPRWPTARSTVPRCPRPTLPKKARPSPAAADEEPRRLIEHVLLRIWNEALERDDVGIHDNFFDIGGHSLIAVTVVQRIQADLACRLSVAVAVSFIRPSPSWLPFLMPAIVPEPEVVVRRLTTGAGPALFCLSGTEQYRRIAEQLRDGTPVYGLLSAPEAALLEHGESLPPVTELAAAYVHAVRRLQPQGPYRITGYSIGGIIAFEACTATSRGRRGGRGTGIA